MTSGACTNWCGSAPWPRRWCRPCSTPSAVELAAGNQHSFRASGTTVIDPGLPRRVRGRQGRQDQRGRGRGPQAAADEAGPERAAQPRSTPTSISPSRRRASPKPRWSRRWRNTASAVRRPTPASSRCCCTATTCSSTTSRFRPTDVGRAVGEFPDQPLHPVRRLRLHRQARGRAGRGVARRGGLDRRCWRASGSRSRRPSTTRASRSTGTEATGARQLGTDPKTGKPITARLGRYGPFVQIGTVEDEEKPTFASLRPGQSMHTITLDEALKLFTLPRKLGELDGKELTVAIGRFGPFAKRGDTYASLGKDRRSLHDRLRARRRADPRPRGTDRQPPDQGVRRQRRSRC